MRICLGIGFCDGRDVLLDDGMRWNGNGGEGAEISELLMECESWSEYRL